MNLIFLKLFIITIWQTTCWVHIAESVPVLDPSLYLSPVPPLAPTTNSVSPAELWSSHTGTNAAGETPTPTNDQKQTNEQTTTEVIEVMEGAETIWPNLFTRKYAFGSIHVPLTFRLTGTYGGYNSDAISLVGSSYASISDENFNRYGSYGQQSPGVSRYISYKPAYPKTRIYGSPSRLAWSGWGNGKWGHYGKG